MRETRQVEIGGTCYKITVLKPTDSIKVMHTLMRGLGPVFAKMDGTDGEDTFGVLAAQMSTALEHISADELQAVLDTFARETQVQKEGGVYVDLPSLFDQQFAGKGLAYMLVWAKQCIALNFADFFDELQSLWQGEKSSEAPPPSPKE